MSKQNSAQYIVRYLLNTDSVDTISRACNRFCVSTFHIIRDFKEIIGVTPKNYIHQSY